MNRMVPDTLYRTADCGHVSSGGLLWLSLAVAVAVACSPPAAVNGGNTPAGGVRVMTYNIQAGGGGLGKVADVIRAAAPDIVALQEVDVHWSERSTFADQAALLGKLLGMHARFALIYRIAATDSTKPPREYGLALLSKCPIQSFTNHTLTRLSTQETNPVPAL